MTGVVVVRVLTLSCGLGGVYGCLVGRCVCVGVVGLCLCFFLWYERAVWVCVCFLVCVMCVCVVCVCVCCV